MKHILITRNKPDGSGFDRCDYWRGRWMQFDHNGHVLHGMFGPIRQEIDDSGGNISITFSSCRMGDAFQNPDQSSIPDATCVIALVPIEDATGDRTRDAMRRWVTLIWHGPGAPTKSDRLVQSRIADWIDDFFTPEQLESWKLPRGGGKTEIWVRPSWNATQMFPELFPDPSVVEKPVALSDMKLAVSDTVSDKNEINDVKEQATDDTSVVKLRYGKPVVRVEWSLKSKWAVIGNDGKEVGRLYLTKNAALDAMEKYLTENKLRLPESLSTA